MKEVITRDKKRLEELEGVIEKNLQSFYELGKALMEIKRDGLYKHKNGGKYQTFEAYCKGEWDFQRTYAYHLIASVEVVNDVSSIDDIQKPANQLQTRPLEKLSADKRRIAWTRAVETAPGGKVTAAHVAKVVKEFTEEKHTPDKPQENLEEMEVEEKPENTEQPKQPQQREEQEFTPTSAAHFIDIAISQLEQIPDDDPMREEELDRLIDWIDKKKKIKKSTSIPSNNYGQPNLFSCEAIAGS